MLLIGLMSGTSADGIDAALVEVTGEGRGTKVRLLHFLCMEHEPEVREAILAACRKETGSVQSLCTLNFELGRHFAFAAREVARGAGVSLDRVEAIASHGQTVWHEPAHEIIEGEYVHGTLQIGEPAVISARTGCRVVSNFRTADMAAGGQGAPLVPYFDWAVLTSDEESRAVLNIGGIANVTHLPKGAAREDVIAFDTGPGNMLIDELARRFTDGRLQRDEGGAWAAEADGKFSSTLLEEMLQHDYFRQEPPKTTGRELFGAGYPLLKTIERFRAQWVAERRWEPLGLTKYAYFRQVDACFLYTAVKFTVEAVGKAFDDHLVPRGGPETLIVGGGGCHNKTLMAALRERLPHVRVTTHAEFGIPDDAKEAMAFALLGYETLHGRPSNMPSATGARRPVVLGSVTQV